MKLTPLAKMILVGCSVLALVSCAHRGAGNNNTNGMMNDGSDMNGAQAAGIGENDDFGGNGNGMGGKGGKCLNKRTYYFDYDRSEVHEEDRPAIFANANYIMSHPRLRVTVEGHTDPRGSREYNVALAERRANAVADMLKSRGVNPDQIRVVSYGAERLAVPGHSEQDYQLDRRAVIVYLQR